MHRITVELTAAEAAAVAEELKPTVADPDSDDIVDPHVERLRSVYRRLESAAASATS